MIPPIPDGPPVFEREITLPAALSHLDQLLAWIETALEDYACPIKTSQQLTMVTEEAFVNIANYAYPGKTGEMILRTGRAGKALALQFEDGGIPFNPLEWPNPKTKGTIEERNIGGLGIYLVKTMTDHVTYQRLNGKNLLTIFKTPDAAGEPSR
ncbi:MAG: ATP-binding protein [Spirochaetaceae bacterium]|jgi:anti-sigma regulatory factor (Ser/Thr protein kinase)|nr:ATP-binding protein [Spirochaetaceae bacterium]